MAMKKVRILVDCHYGKANDVVALDITKIKEAKLASLIDDHPDAVKYAEGLTSATPETTLDPADLPPAASDASEPETTPEPAAPEAAQPALDLEPPAAPVSPETADTAEDHGRKTGRKS